MKLYCVRHCEANGADVDSERGLSEQGVLDADKLAEHLQQQRILIPEVIHSGKKRAQQTAEILAGAAKAEKITVAPTLLDDQADVTAVVEMARTWVQDTMLVGHMPFMANLVGALMMDLGDNLQLVTYSPGTIACLNYISEGRWVIDWVLKPENLL
jgi:phosphohistidine phosphatase